MLYTITHKIGTGGGRQAVGGGHSAASTGLNPSPSKNNQQLPLMLKDELYSYARNAFGFSMAGHRKLLSLTAETKVISNVECCMNSSKFPDLIIRTNYETACKSSK